MRESTLDEISDLRKQEHQFLLRLAETNYRISRDINYISLKHSDVSCLYFIDVIHPKLSFLLKKLLEEAKDDKMFIKIINSLHQLLLISSEDAKLSHQKVDIGMYLIDFSGIAQE